MRETEDIIFYPCDDIKCIQADVKVEDEGYLLRVPVYLNNVCPCRNVVVAVQIFVEGKIYAMKTKEVFTGGRPY